MKTIAFICIIAGFIYTNIILQNLVDNKACFLQEPVATGKPLPEPKVKRYAHH